MLTPPRRPLLRPILNVLLVDPRLDEVRRVFDLLQKGGEFHVHGARGAADARRELESGAFDVALIDFECWRGRAGALAAHLAEHHPDLTVVLLTSSENERDALDALRSGAHDFYSRAYLEDGEHLAARLLAAVAENRSLRRRDTMVRWLEREARTDLLTGLHNRRAFDERLPEVCSSALRDGNPVALILLDVVGTGVVNDVHGQEAGDGMIRRTALAIARSIRGGDFAARIGGDDFGIILADGEMDLARRVARRITHELDQLNAANEEGEIPVEVAFGVACGKRCSPQEIFSAADAELTGGRSGSAVVPLFAGRRDPDGPSVA